MSEENVQSNGVTQKARANIAKYVIWGALGGLIALSAVMIWTAKAGGAGAASEKVFTMLVPLLGTWVGTVLAYYFSGEAYEKASQSMSDMVKQVTEKKLAAVKVKDAMIQKNAMTIVTLPPGDDGSKVNLEKELIAKLNPPVTRLPVLDEKDVAKYIIHQSLLYKFVTEKSIEMGGKTPPTPFTVGGQTLKDFLSHKDMKRQVERTFAFVSLSASLADAKKAMEAVNDCQDVFVTDDGSSDKPVRGWLTNIGITRHSKA